MRLLLASNADVASINIRDRLLEMADWREEDLHEGFPSYRRSDQLMITTKEFHLYQDSIDERISQIFDGTIEQVIFLSRHRAASGIPTLTVHPIGNFGKADLGGREGTLVKASPHLMTGMLRKLTSEAKGLPFQVSFEVTHHGPFLDVPCTYIEIGSDESTWEDAEAAKAIASTVIDFVPEEHPIVVGVGGGHYAPRFSEISLTKKVSFGHMIANYVLKDKDDNEIAEIFRKGMSASGTRSAYVHKKSFSRPEARRMKDILEAEGFAVLEGDDLEDLSE